LLLGTRNPADPYWAKEHANSSKDYHSSGCQLQNASQQREPGIDGVLWIVVRCCGEDEPHSHRCLIPSAPPAALLLSKRPGTSLCLAACTMRVGKGQKPPRTTTLYSSRLSRHREVLLVIFAFPPWNFATRLCEWRIFWTSQSAYRSQLAPP
jgi:hypothetical protein